MLAALMLLNLVVGAQARAAEGDPDIPTILRPVHLTDQGEYARPYMPVFRTTRDGRLGYNQKGTQGKMVMLDNLINNIDYSAPDQEDSGHRILDMYAPFTGLDPTHEGWIRVGNGRDNNGTAGLDGNPTNTSFLESIENKLNYWPHMRPTTPSDAVWLFSHGAVCGSRRADKHIRRTTCLEQRPIGQAPVRRTVQALWAHPE